MVRFVCFRHGNGIRETAVRKIFPVFRHKHTGLTQDRLSRFQVTPVELLVGCLIDSSVNGCVVWLFHCLDCLLDWANWLTGRLTLLGWSTLIIDFAGLVYCDH